MSWETVLLQLVWLLVLPLAVASISWTVTHEEIFREPREYCVKRSRSSPRWITRKAFYVFTCEYCFSHYVTLAFVWATGYRLLLEGWRGAVVAFFATNAVANLYLSAFARLRLEVKSERLETEVVERQMRSTSPPPRVVSGPNKR
jgi:hypothetical protein